MQPVQARPSQREDILDSGLRDTESEWWQALRLYNATEIPYPDKKLIHELFQEQVQRTPDAVAVLHRGQSLTYKTLNAIANQFARHLREKSIGPDQPVGICVERSLEMVIALLGILKAAGAYVPLDPSYPRERLQSMLSDAAPQLLLTQARLKEGLPSTGAEVITLDEMRDKVAQQSCNDLDSAMLGLRSCHLVYVIYTSGSTGTPKGIAMEHHSMVNLIEWHRREFGDGAGRRVLQFAALSFDVAFQEIFSTLCTGATLVLLDEQTRKDFRALTDLLIDSHVNRLFMTPLMLQGLADHLENAGAVPDGLRDVVVAGEQLRITLRIGSLFRRMQDCRLHNHYGPAESHVVTALTLVGDPAGWPSLPTIGRPISNSQIYVLDPHQLPVPVGVPGEIYIGGAGVSRGYIHRPELTEERFVKDPFSSNPQARLYKTGDLGRWWKDGQLEYLGRSDRQVKIRGFRIELDEIEAQLLRHPKVTEAVVLAHVDGAGEKRLVAYVVGQKAHEADGALTVGAVREHLKSALPDYMVPGAFVMLGSMPLTVNGKLDRRALLEPQSWIGESAAYVAPRTETEQILANIYTQVLKVNRVGVHDSFLDLGGHSLHAMGLIAKIAEKLKVDVSVVEVLQSLTIDRMAKVIQSKNLPDNEPTGIDELEYDEGVI